MVPLAVTRLVPRDPIGSGPLAEQAIIAAPTSTTANRPERRPFHPVA
jgi:hypothetical protein